MKSLHSRKNYFSHYNFPIQLNGNTTISNHMPLHKVILKTCYGFMFIHKDDGHLLSSRLQGQREMKQCGNQDKALVSLESSGEER